MSDLISRQAAIEAVNTALFPKINTAKDAEKALRNLPSAQPEDCDTCKHGYFGDSQCDNCRVGYPSHYERRTDDGE